MPFCPDCRNEYMDGVRRCADCAVDLIDDLAAHDAARRNAAAAKVARIEGPGGYLASFVAMCTQAGVPARRVEGAVEVPYALLEQIETALLSTVEYERDDAIVRVLGPRADVEPKYEIDPTVFQRDLATLRGDLQTTMPALANVLGAGTPRQKAWALQVLRALEAAGATRVGDALAWLCKEGFKKPLFALVAELAATPVPGVLQRVVQELPRLSKVALELAFHALAQLPDRAVAPAVLPFLEHDDPDVRAEADEVLMSISGRDLGFDAEAAAPARAAIVKQWREWVARASGSSDPTA